MTKCSLPSSGSGLVGCSPSIGQVTNRSTSGRWNEGGPLTSSVGRRFSLRSSHQRRKVRAVLLTRGRGAEILDEVA